MIPTKSFSLRRCFSANSSAARRVAVPVAAAAAAAGPQIPSSALYRHSPSIMSTLWPAQLRCQINHSVHSVACRAGPTLQSATTYDFSPHVDPNVLGSQLLVLAVTVGAAAYWWLAVVPSARRTLAKEKRAGKLNEYLLELQANPGKKAERWFYTDWLLQLQKRQQMAAQAAAKRQAAAGTSATAEGSSSDDMIRTTSGSTEQKTAPEASAGFVGDVHADVSGQMDVEDKEPAFWSLDNPILATGALLGAVALISALLHEAQQR